MTNIFVCFTILISALLFVEIITIKSNRVINGLVGLFEKQKSMQNTDRANNVTMVKNSKCTVFLS